MNLKIYQRVNGDMVLGDEDDEGAPMAVVSIYNEFAELGKVDDYKIEMLKMLVDRIVKDGVAIRKEHTSGITNE